MFGSNCSLCGTDRWGFLRMDGRHGQMCPSCCQRVDQMRAEYDEANPDADFRWAIDEKRELKAKYEDIREHLQREEERWERRMAELRAEEAEYERQLAAGEVR